MSVLYGSSSLPDLDACLARSAALHRHLCPRQVLGARMGLYAGELLQLDLPRSDKRLIALVETDGCFADGISAVTGCWFGRRTLRLVDHGKVASIFVDTHTERAVRIWPAPDARQQAAAYAPNEPRRWYAQRIAYQIMPTIELLRAQPVQLTINLASIISRPGIRVNCVVCGEEIINERQVLIGEQPSCRACAGDAYFLPLDGTTLLSEAIDGCGSSLSGN